MYVIRLVLTLLCLVSALKSLSQNQDFLSAAELQQDYEILIKVLRSAHPSLHRFTSPWEFDRQTDFYESLMEDSLSQLQFFQIISATMSSVDEAHSSAEISGSIKQKLQNEARLLPFEIHFQDSSAYILRDLSDSESGLAGRQLISINGLEMDQIIKRIDSLSCIGSGNNISRIYRKLSYKQNFGLSFYLFVDQSKSFLVEYQIDGDRKATVVDGIAADFEVAAVLNPKEKVPPFEVTIDKHKNLAVIRISTFAHFVIGMKTKEYLKFYKSAFKQIEEAQVDNLVIDVRDNRGGQEMLGAELLSYFAEKPIRVHDLIFSKRLDFSFLDSLNVLRQDFNDKYFAAADSGYVATDIKQDAIHEIKPKTKNRFDGSVYILTNGNCFSACNIFMALADFHELATIVGEESGGTYQGSDGYPGLFFRLPNSGIGVDFRLWHLRTAVSCPVKGRGISPDLPVQPSASDVINGRDAAMERILQEISEQ